MSRRLSDWIDTWLDYNDNTEPPVSYHLWTALSILSAAVERKVYLQWHTKIYANLYVVLVGPAGKTKKGTAMGPGLSMLRKLESLNIAAEATTKEALVDSLKKHGDRSFQHPTDPGNIYKYSAMTVYSEELTVFLGYSNVDLMAWLCDWYDCRADWTYRTRGRGEEALSNVWVSLFGAITPALLQSTMPTDMLGGGLASRTIYVYEQNRRKKVPVPYEYNEQTQMFDLIQHHAFESDLFRDLETISNLTGQFRFTKEFLQFWEHWYTKSRPPKIEDPRMETYRQRRPTHFLKLSMLLNISRCDDMLLTVEDAERAIAILEKTEERMHMTFAGMGKSDMAQLTQEIQTYIGLEKSVRYSDIVRRFHFDASHEELARIIATLVHMKFCRRDRIDNERLDWNIVYLK